MAGIEVKTTDRVTIQCPVRLPCRGVRGDASAPRSGGLMTVLRFSGGETLKVAIEFGELLKLLQKALANGGLMEINTPDHGTLVVNAHQVQYVQDADDAFDFVAA